VIERHDFGGEARPAVGADRTMLGKQPGARFSVGRATGRMRGEPLGRNRCAAGALTATTTGAFSGRLARTGLVGFVATRCRRLSLRAGRPGGGG
jgi:hypothetical protein